MKSYVREVEKTETVLVGEVRLDMSVEEASLLNRLLQDSLENTRGLIREEWDFMIEATEALRKAIDAVT